MICNIEFLKTLYRYSGIGIVWKEIRFFYSKASFLCIHVSFMAPLKYVRDIEHLSHHLESRIQKRLKFPPKEWQHGQLIWGKRTLFPRDLYKYVLLERDFPEPILWPGDGMFRPSILLYLEDHPRTCKWLLRTCKWLVTRIYIPFRPFGRGITLS